MLYLGIRVFFSFFYFRFFSSSSVLFFLPLQQSLVARLASFFSSLPIISVFGAHLRYSYSYSALFWPLLFSSQRRVDLIAHSTPQMAEHDRVDRMHLCSFASFITLPSASLVDGIESQKIAHASKN